MTKEEKEKLKEIPKEYRPVSAMTLFWYNVLFSLPVIGWICLLAFAFKSDQIAVRNYAWTCFMVSIFEVVFLVFLMLTWDQVLEFFGEIEAMSAKFVNTYFVTLS